MDLGKERSRNWKSPESWSWQKTGTEDPQKAINMVKNIWPGRWGGVGNQSGSAQGHAHTISGLPGFSFVLNQKQRLPWVRKVKGLPSVALRLQIYVPCVTHEPCKLRNNTNMILVLPESKWKETFMSGHFACSGYGSGLRTCSQIKIQWSGPQDWESTKEQ